MAKHLSAMAPAYAALWRGKQRALLVRAASRTDTDPAHTAGRNAN
jgi:hypothetical protein